MKDTFFFSKRGLGCLSLTLFVFIASVSAALGNSSDSAAISFLQESHLSLSEGTRNILLSCVSNDRNATGWTAEVESEDTVYALEVMAIPTAKIKSNQNSNNQSAMRRSLSRATLRLALYLDNGKLNRERFANENAANYALLMSYRGKIKGGIQSFSRALDNRAISLVWVKRDNVKDNNQAQSERQLTEDYCKYLYKTANDLFNAKKFDEALKTFHQIHYMAWANIDSYIGASVCFLKMNQKDDAIKLTSELVNVFSKDMTPDEMANAGKILFSAGEKDKGFNVLELAYKNLKSQGGKK